MEQVSQWVNHRIRLNETVVIEDEVAIEDAKAKGAMALFGEKYGNHVRTIQAGEDSYELCGGNHVNRTGDLGSFVIVAESAVAAGIRRIEALAGASAEMRIASDRQCLTHILQHLKIDPARALSRVHALQDEIKQLKKALQKARKEGGGVNLEQLIAQQKQVQDLSYIATQVALTDRKALATVMDHLRERCPRAVSILLAVNEEGSQVMVSVGVGHELKKSSRIHAGNIIKKVAPLVGGKGGGRPDFANGAGQSVDQIPHALEQIPNILNEMLAV